MKNRVSKMISLIVLFISFICHDLRGQMEFGFIVPEGKKRIEVEFEQYNNLIIIPIVINKHITLKFILDTGVKTAILTNRIYADIIGLTYVREIRLQGPGVKDTIEAYVTNNVTLEIPGGVTGKNMTMLVLKEDFLELSKHMGDEIHGIIGFDVFDRFVVHINYDRNLLVLFDPNHFKPRKRATKLPLKIKHKKPFVNALVSDGDKKDTLEFMIDTGASHAALLDFSQLDAISMPENKIFTQIGHGIAGVIPGFIIRLSSIEIAQYLFEKPLISAPLDDAYYKMIKRGARYGTIGGAILNRFNVTLDYHRNALYVTKSRKYRDKFEYNMSGMTLKAVGDELNILQVSIVEEDSPASSCELMEGDIILSIMEKPYKIPIFRK